MLKNTCLIVLCICIVILTGLSTAGATIYIIPVNYDYSTRDATNYPSYNDNSTSATLPSDMLHAACGYGIGSTIVYSSGPFGIPLWTWIDYSWHYRDSSYLEFYIGQLQTLQDEFITSATINFTYQNGSGSPSLYHLADLSYETAGIINSQNGWSADVTPFILSDVANGDNWSDWKLMPYEYYANYDLHLYSIEGGHPAYLSITTAPVPLPPTVLLLGSGLLGLVGLRRKLKK